MNALDVAQAGIVVAGASGAALACFGLALLFARPWRSYTVQVAAFLIVWGSWAILANLWRYTGLMGHNVAARRWFLLSCCLLVLVYVPLLYFAVSYPRPHDLLRKRRLVLGLLFVPAAIGAIVLAFWPGAFLGDFTGHPREVSTALGWAFYAYFGAMTLAFTGALAALTRFHRAAVAEIDRRRAGYAMLAFGAFVGYLCADTIGAHVVAAFTSGPRALWSTPGALLLLASPLGVIVLIFAYVSLMRARGPTRPRHVLVALVYGGSLLGGATTGAVRAGLSNQLVETVGVWRVAFAVFLGYSVLRFQLFDLERRVEKGLVIGGLWATFAFLALMLLRGLQATIPAGDWAEFVWTAVILVMGFGAAWFSLRYWHSAANGARPGWSSRRRHEEHRQEVYEAALAESVAMPQQAEPGLARLRSELGIAEGEHAALRSMVFGPQSPVGSGTVGAGEWLAHRYQVERRLGTGGFGQTLLAWDALLARRVVLKQLRSLEKSTQHESVRRFLLEARLAARVEHPNLTRVYDFGVVGDQPYIVLEHVKGSTLDAKGRRGIPEALRIMRGVLRGLRALHHAGILHGDVKPSNIILDADGSPRVTDFGSAVLQGSMEAARPSSGSPSFMSPEAADGEPLTERSDVYSAAALFYFLVAGEPYVRLDGLDIDEMRIAITMRPPRPLKRVPQTVSAIILVGLSKDPHDRPQSAAIYLEAVTALTTLPDEHSRHEDRSGTGGVIRRGKAAKTGPRAPGRRGAKTSRRPLPRVPS